MGNKLAPLEAVELEKKPVSVTTTAKLIRTKPDPNVTPSLIGQLTGVGVNLLSTHVPPTKSTASNNSHRFDVRSSYR